MTDVAASTAPVDKQAPATHGTHAGAAPAQPSENPVEDAAAVGEKRKADPDAAPEDNDKK